jgi:hypothetical protein
MPARTLETQMRGTKGANMRWRESQPAVLTGMFVLAVVVSMTAQAPVPVTYEAFCKLDQETRRRTFNEATAENRADLVRTHIERWQEANRDRLTPQQLALLKELLAFITPDAYRGGATTEDARIKAKDIQTRQATVFTRDEMQQMQPSAPCILKKG